MWRMRFRSFLKIRRCVLYHFMSCVVVGCRGGQHRFQVRWVSVFRGLWWNVGSSQCLSGEPSMRWALLHDLCVSCVRYGGRFRDAGVLGILCVVGLVFCVKWLLARRVFMLFLIFVIWVS